MNRHKFTKYEIISIILNAAIVATGKNKKYCSEKCNGKAKWKRKKERLMKKSPTKTNASLSEIARLAKENGMTYGEYVAAKRI